MPKMTLWQLGEGRQRVRWQGHLQGKDRHEAAGLPAEMSIVKMSIERESGAEKGMLKEEGKVQPVRT